MLKTLGARFAREDGNATIEFVILFPLFLGVFASAFEAGLLSTRHAMLDRATDLAVRDLRLGVDPTPTYDELKSSICNYAGVIPDCGNALHVELETVDKANWSFRTGQIQCIDREEDITPVVSFSPGVQHEMMLITVCAVVETMIPVTGLGLKLPKISGDDYALITMSAFVNEPS
ncbi:MAG: pilus assembly protein [Rhodobacter sp.]|nr:pilus assembly protein [Rhodobacter sp.]